MDRREFLKRTSGAAAAAASVAGATAHAEPVQRRGSPPPARTLRLSMPWPDDGKGFGDSARRLARRIEAATGSRYRIEIIENATLSGLEAIATGAADLYHASEQSHVPAHPAFAYFAGLPCAQSLSAEELRSWLLVGGGQELWDDLAAEFGVKALLAGHTGPSMLWSVKPFETRAEIAGEPVIATGLLAEVARGLGAEPVECAPSKVAALIASGGATAASYGGWIASMSLGLPEAARYALSSSLTGSGTAMALGVSRSLWDDMPEPDRAAFASAASEELSVTLAEAQALAEPISIALRHRFGTVTGVLGREIEDAIARVGGAVVAHAAGTDAAAQRINASYMGFARERQAVA